MQSLTFRFAIASAALPIILSFSLGTGCAQITSNQTRIDGDAAVSNDGDAATIDVDALWKTCVIATACGGGPSAASWNVTGTGADPDSCYRELLEAKVQVGGATAIYNTLPIDDFIACGANVASCADWFACASPKHGVDYCAMHVGATCDGNLAVTCASASVGAKLESCPSGQFGCRMIGADALCSDGTACSDPDSEGCVGNISTACGNSGVMEGQDCGGESCVASGAPGPLTTSCVRADASNCMSSQTCQGDVASVCTTSGEAHENCAAGAMHCNAGAPDEAVFGICEPNATECVVGAAPSCSGTSYTECVNGRSLTFDCNAIALKCSSSGLGCQ